MSEPKEPLWIMPESANEEQILHFATTSLASLAPSCELAGTFCSESHGWKLGSKRLEHDRVLRSALERPINKWRYELAELAELASAYAFGLAKNHAFVDGNKRIAFMAMRVFLMKNDVAFSPKPEHATSIILALAAGEVSEESLTRWIRDNWPSE